MCCGCGRSGGGGEDEYSDFDSLPKSETINGQQLVTAKAGSL